MKVHLHLILVASYMHSYLPLGKCRHLSGKSINITKSDF